MNETLEIIQDLEELRSLYRTDELRDIDFDAMLYKYRKAVSDFERDMEEQLREIGFLQQVVEG